MSWNNSPAVSRIIGTINRFVETGQGVVEHLAGRERE
jgi:hypothetical protein